MRIIVCGAGIAGLALAGRLQHHGHDVMVVEHSAGLRGGDYMIDFIGPGFDEAERLGLLPDLEAAHYPVQNLVFVDGDGHPRIVLPYRDVRRLWFNGRHFNFMRGDLERVLYRRVRPGTVRFGVSVSQIVQDAKHVEAALTDDTHVSADLLVGADGVHSVVRRLSFGPDDQFVRPLGYRSAAFVIATPPRRLAADDFVTMTIPGRQVAVYPVREGLATFFLWKESGTPHRVVDHCSAIREAFGDLIRRGPRYLSGTNRPNGHGTPENGTSHGALVPPRIARPARPP